MVLPAPGVTLESLSIGDEVNNKGDNYRFEDHYTLQDKLSKGSFGIVYVTKHKESGEEYAVKVIDRTNLSQKDNDGVLREVSVMKALCDVDHAARLVDFYASPQCFHVVQIYAEGGDVFHRLAERTTYNEKDARDLAKNMLGAIEIIHQRGIAHRDLKPENLLLRSMYDDTSVLIADFGFACYVPENGYLKTRCGTPAFVAPEVLVRGSRYRETVDVWSAGCLLYMIIGGYPPFQDQNHRGLFRKIRGADYCFHDAYWKNVSISAKRLIAHMLTPDPHYRCTASETLKSKWLKIRDAQLTRNDLHASINEIKKFNARHTLKGAMHAVLWSVRTKFRTATDDDFSKQMSQWDKDYEAKERVGKALLTKDRPSLKFEDVYELGRKLHRSNLATIYQCEHRKRKDIMAVKVIPRQSKMGSPGGKTIEEKVMHELAVLSALKHKYIIEIVDFFETDDDFYLVMELMEGGDVFDRILSIDQYTEKDARDLCKILLEGVKHLHQKGIVHRDLKPQNLLLKSKDNNADIKIADFGFACRVHTPQSLTTRCGTPTYVAPEILKNIPYDESVDMWSVGVIVYVLLCGYPPFSNDNQALLFQSIRMGEYGFDKVDWRHISDDARDLVRNLLVVDPSRRWTASKALSCAWLTTADEHNLSGRDLSGTTAVVKQRRLRFKYVARSIMWLQPMLAQAAQKASSEGTETTDLEEKSGNSIRGGRVGNETSIANIELT